MQKKAMTRWTILFLVTIFLLLRQPCSGQTSKNDIPVIIHFGKAIDGTETMTTEEICKIDSLSITDLKGNKSEYKIVGFQISIYGMGWDNWELSQNNKLTDKQKKIIQSFQPGTKFYIEKIRIFKNGEINELNKSIAIKILKTS
jgi:hypothetical protein